MTENDGNNVGTIRFLIGDNILAGLCRIKRSQPDRVGGREGISGSRRSRCKGPEVRTRLAWFGAARGPAWPEFRKQGSNLPFIFSVLETTAMTCFAKLTPAADWRAGRKCQGRRTKHPDTKRSESADREGSLFAGLRT